MSQISSSNQMIPVNNSFLISSPILEFIEGNRMIKNYDKISDIENHIKNGGYIPPISVDRTTSLIIDGQHRYLAACNLWKQGIEYQLNIIVGDFENPLLAAITCNSKATNWHSINYVEAYIVDGRDSFKLLKKFVEEHPLFQNITIYNTNYMGAAQLLTGSSCYAVIPHGTLVLTEEQCKKAEKLYKELEILVTITGKKIMSKSIILAYIELRPKIKNFNRFYKAMKKRFVYPKFSSRGAWFKALEEVKNTL